MFKSSEHINKKGDVPYHGFGYLILFSDPVDLATSNKLTNPLNILFSKNEIRLNYKARIIMQFHKYSTYMSLPP